MVHIRSAKADLFTKESMTKLIESMRGFKVESFSKKSLVKKTKPAPKPVTKN